MNLRDPAMLTLRIGEQKWKYSTRLYILKIAKKACTRPLSATGPGPIIANTYYRQHVP